MAKWKPQHTVALVAALAMPVAGVVITLLNKPDSERPTPTPETLTAKFTKPARNDVVANDGVIRAEGTISGPLGEMQVWLLDNDGTYTPDMQVRLVGQKWTARSEGVFKPGLASGEQARTKLDIVVANAACADFLAKKLEADDSTFKVLPTGCSVTDERILTVTG